MINPTRVRGLLCLCFVSMSAGCDRGPAATAPDADGADTAAEILAPDTDADDTGADDTGADPEPTRCDPDDVRGCLEALGVTVDTDSPRVGPDGAPLPEDHAPLGASVSFHAGTDDSGARAEGVSAPVGTRELFLGGVLRERTDAPAAWLELDADDDAHTRFTTDTIDELSSYDFAQTVGGDVDADGRAEVIGLQVRDGVLSATLLEDRRAGFTVEEDLPLGTVSGDFTALAGDVDGDGGDDLIVAAFSADGRSVTVRAYALTSTGFVEQATAAPAGLVAPGSVGAARLSVGNLDFDVGEEIVLVIEERFTREGQPAGRADRWIFDDLNAGLAELDQGPVIATLDGLPQRAELADVVVADLDGDGVDEIAFGGLSSRSGTGDCAFAYLVIPLDDRSTGFAEGPARRACQETAADVDAVFVEAFDVDGDGLPELAINATVFDDLLQTGPPTVKVALSDDDLGVTGATRLHPDTVRFATGDLTNDGREDLLIYLRDEDTLQVWGEANPGGELPETREGGWRQLHTVALRGAQGDVPPALLALDIDNADAAVVKLTGAEHQVVYTQPVVLAVLAAPPCYPEDLYGQDESRCRTAYGTTETTGASVSTSYSVSAGGAVVGVYKGSVPLLAKSKAEVTARVIASLGRSWTSSYQVTKTVTYTTAPLTDEVIFTSLPLDTYTYTIVSHPDPELEGAELVVTLPREFTTYKVPLSHFERNAVAESLDIREAVIGHTAGDPISYPTASEKDALVEESRVRKLAVLSTDEEGESLLGDLIDVHDLHDLIDDFIPMGDLVTMEVGPAAVNPGDGFVSQSLSYASSDVETHSGRIAGILRLKVTQEVAGLGGGFELQVGAEAGAGLSVLRGSNTVATGTVADIPEENHLANEYDWGLFTYLHVDESTGQQFDVIHYWVD